MPSSGDNREDQNANRDDSIGGLPPSIAERLRDVLIDEDAGDLLMQSGDGGGDFRRWIEALDMQGIGACRNDERLKPLLKLNASNGVAEDRLLAHLSLHFEPSEVGLLARCLCLPLVSVRVGKIEKQGTLLSPTSIRGNLCLTLLPTSDMRISFNGDDGCVEKLATLTDKTQPTSVEIQEISADTSGRSFSIKTSDLSVSYFWCCEKSKLLGEELLSKMKDFLSNKLSLAELTGISESRLNYFASELRGAYLSEGSNISNSPPPENSVNSLEHQSSTSHCHIEVSNLLNEGIIGDTSSSSAYVAASNDLSCMGTTSSRALLGNACPFDSDFVEKHEALETTIEGYPLFFGTIGKLPEYPLFDSNLQITPSSSTLSPHYCWCPPLTSSNESLPLPPLASLLSSPSSTTALNLSDLPPLDFPKLMPSSGGHIPTFTPLMCDPIVHIPVIDICSSGPGYMVSAGSAISTALSQDLMESDPTVESSARETLRLLLSSSSQPLRSGGSMQSVLVGSRGLYGGTLDVLAPSRSEVANQQDYEVDKEKPPSSSGSKRTCEYDGA